MEQDEFHQVIFSRSLSFDSFQTLLQLARGLANEGKVAALDGRPDAAAAIYLDVMRLGHVAGRGGLLIDASVGSAIEGMGLQGLCEIRRATSREMIRKLIERLLRMDAEREPPETMANREAIWQQHAFGWSGRIVFEPENAWGGTDRNLWGLNRARARLLIYDLAIRLYRVERRELPERLERLAPEYLHELPADPFSGEPPVYRPSGENFLLYSIGPDRKDDGGKPADAPPIAGDLVLVP